jgi:hypothetical protein
MSAFERFLRDYFVDKYDKTKPSKTTKERSEFLDVACKVRDDVFFRVEQGYDIERYVVQNSWGTWEFSQIPSYELSLAKRHCFEFLDCVDQIDMKFDMPKNEYFKVTVNNEIKTENTTIKLNSFFNSLTFYTCGSFFFGMKIDENQCYFKDELPLEKEQCIAATKASSVKSTPKRFSKNPYASSTVNQSDD